MPPHPSHPVTPSKPPFGSLSRLMARLMARRPAWCLWRVLFVLALLGLPFWLSCGAGKKAALDSISPKQGFAGQVTKLSILGQGFPDGPVKIVLVGASLQVELGAPLRIDDTRLEATLPATAAPGPYDLQVTFGTQTPLLLGGAFLVTEQALQVHFIEVGQGDATLLISPTQKTMLIDAGPPGQAPQIEAVMQRLGIRHLDHVIATHYDADHVGSLEALVKGPDGKENTEDDHEIREGLWDPGGSSKNASYSRVRSRFASVHKPLDGLSKESFPTIDLGGGVTIDVLTAGGSVIQPDGTRKTIPCGTDANCLSIGTLIKIGKVRMWTAGDLTGGGNDTPDVETVLASTIGRVDLYRAHHHGSKTSSNQALLDALQPQVVVISAGKDNSYCHPHAEILERMIGIRDEWVFVTSDAVISAKDCGKTTKERLAPIGGRGVVAIGTFSLIADPQGFTIRVPSEPQPVRWTAR